MLTQWGNLLDLVFISRFTVGQGRENIPVYQHRVQIHPPPF